MFRVATKAPLFENRAAAWFSFHTIRNTIERMNNFCNRLLRIYSRLLKKMVLTGPSYLRDILRRYYAGESMEFCMRNLKDKGFNPSAIIDCGAFMGDWTRMAKKVFPKAQVIMIEPQEDKKPFLVRVQNEFPGTVEYIRCLLGDSPKDVVTFFEMESGSSVLEEMTLHPRRVVSLQMKTLDGILSEKNIADGIFLKLDVQGFEIEVLKGAEKTMQKADLILLETSLLRCNRSAPLFSEVIQFMKDRGFLAYDICNLQRWRDNILLQADIFFVKENSAFRKSDLLTREN
jgi:FkbM family methyltransferase